MIFIGRYSIQPSDLMVVAKANVRNGTMHITSCPLIALEKETRSYLTTILVFTTCITSLFTLFSPAPYILFSHCNCTLIKAVGKRSAAVQHVFFRMRCIKYRCQNLVRFCAPVYHLLGLQMNSTLEKYSFPSSTRCWLGFPLLCRVRKYSGVNQVTYAGNQHLARLQLQRIQDPIVFRAESHCGWLAIHHSYLAEEGAELPSEAGKNASQTLAGNTASVTIQSTCTDYLFILCVLYIGRITLYKRW